MLAVSTDRGASFPLDTIVSADRWRLEDCPAEAPSLVWNGAAGGALAWYSGASPGGVFLMSWHPDHGAAGIKRPIEDDVAGARRPRMSAVSAATWVMVEDPGRALVSVRLIQADGNLTPWATLGAGVRTGWIAAQDPRTAVACWSEMDEAGTRVRVVRLRRR
jgi:hypothetical protein